MRPIAFLFFLLIYFLQADSQGYLSARGSAIVDGQGNEIQLRGIGLGGWMLQEPYMLRMSGIGGTQHEIRKKIEDLIGTSNTEIFYKTWLANDIRKADIDSMSKWGFNSIRLPMHFDLFTLPAEEEPAKGKDTWLETGFRMVDSLLGWCSKDHIYLVLDLHAAPGGQGNDVAISDRYASRPSLWESDDNKSKTIALWTKLAERYRNEKWIGGYDLLNETNWGFENANDKNGCAEKTNLPLKKLLTDITEAIRKVDTHHLIFIEANCWANNYNGMLPLWDGNMAVSFHKYWNNNDQSSIEKFIQIREKYKVPVWMGEGGENSNAWFTDAIGLLEKNKLGWAWWPWKKMGINNPVQVKTDSGFNRLLNFWKGTAPAPSADEAFAILMKLAKDIRIENNIVHKDVTDAMFRQVYSTSTLPFKKQSVRNGTKLFACDYDLGRSGYAYHDLDSADYHVSAGGKRSVGNKGGLYRNDGVDIRSCNDSVTNGFSVFSIEEGEWLQFTIHVKEAGKYRINIRALSDSGSAGQLGFVVNSKEINSVTLSGAKSWITNRGPEVQMAAGKHIIRIVCRKQGFDLNYLEFDKLK